MANEIKLGLQHWFCLFVLGIRVELLIVHVIFTRIWTIDYGNSSIRSTCFSAESKLAILSLQSAKKYVFEHSSYIQYWYQLKIINRNRFYGGTTDNIISDCKVCSILMWYANIPIANAKQFGILEVSHVCQSQQRDVCIFAVDNGLVFDDWFVGLLN